MTLIYSFKELKRQNLGVNKLTNLGGCHLNEE